MIDTVVIGGGQAGLSLSYFLTQRGVEHVVLERDRAFSAWYGRWDSFCMNTANWMNGLPGCDRPFVVGGGDYGIATKEQALVYFEAYVKAIDPPLREGVAVTCVVEGSGVWTVETEGETYRAKHVVICTGHAAQVWIPDIGGRLPLFVPQVHSAQYRRIEQVKTSRVLVVGSGSSGVQICKELAQSGRFREVCFSVSGNAVIPWSILGIPIGVVPRVVRVFDVRRDSWFGQWVMRRGLRGDPAMAPAPRVLARNSGVRLVGKVVDVRGDALVCADGAVVELDDLTVIWCTGFRPDYDFIRVQQPEKVFGVDGPIHNRGVASGAPGLFFVGLKFQYTLGSQLLYGVGRDANYVADHIAVCL